MSLTNIVIAGVGGQGTLLSSRIIGGAAMKNGMDVKVSEVHGMAQRGGSVVTFVAYNKERVYSPISAPGRADIVLAFEKLEAYRSIPYLKKHGRMIINDQNINPMPVLNGSMSIPDDILNKINEYEIQVESLDALALAIEAGDALAVNVSLIGRLAALLPMPKESWTDTMREIIKPSMLDLNLKAFELGYNWVA
jgi:indolepyruvate ferredoxin oxidoreductase beta subunit